MENSKIISSCSCSEQVKELAQINEYWRNDYAVLMQQNNQLKANIQTKDEQLTTISARNEMNKFPSVNIEYTVEQIEALKSQITLCQEEYQKEKKERINQEQLSNEWKNKYENTVQLNLQLSDRIQRLEFQMKFIGQNETERAKRGAKERMEQDLSDGKNKGKLMECEIFPKKRCCDEHIEPTYYGIDERDDSTNTIYTQNTQRKPNVLHQNPGSPMYKSKRLQSKHCKKQQLKFT